MSCKETHDTFENMMLERINKALNQDEFNQLNTNDDKWNDLYIKFFLGIYLQICNLSGISCAKGDKRTVEPVTLHVNIKRKKINGEQPPILHCVSIPFLKDIFDTKTYKTVNNSFNCSFTLPSVFPFIDDGLETNSIINNVVLNGTITTRLLAYYIFADHAAYHYLQFIATGDSDYQHKNIINRSSNLKPSEVVHCHDIITKKPNKHLSKYLTSHDILKIEDKEHEDGYVNCNYRNMFSDDSGDETE
ncbi:PmV-like protein [Carcinus maenas nudivirus]|uniref:PmV-like protein n=1 Tax=Carcinus maenas nudivirus TaxID=2880837 RepID=A0AAE8Y2K1_9VIRU|nr:PmV-like protein [Carcinus maenas nudivirus]UBZ25622.1 PmV-like protein [Carcinus maenas nudivirus]